MALLLLYALQAVEFPLREGARWTYETRGRESLVLEVGKAHDDVRGWRVLQIRGAEPLWVLSDYDQAVLASFPEGLQIRHPRVFGSWQPWLLRAPLAAGVQWKLHRQTTARVIRFEPVTVPAGTFEAWRIEYAPDREPHKRGVVSAWYVPGTGFVRWQVIIGTGVTRFSPRYFEYELAQIDLDRKRRPSVAPPPPGLSSDLEARARALIAQLDADDPRDRDAAMKELGSLGRGVLPLLEEAAAQTPEVLERMKLISDGFGPAEFVATSLRTEAFPGGGPLPVRFHLRNLSREPILLLPSMSRTQYPRIRIEIRDQNGELWEPLILQEVSTPRGESPNGKVVELLPGESFDPFGPGASRPEALAGVPRQPGTYTLECIYDNRALHPEAWLPPCTSRIQHPVDEDVFRTLPGRFVSNKVTFTVPP